MPGREERGVSLRLTKIFAFLRVSAPGWQVRNPCLSVFIRGLYFQPFCLRNDFIQIGAVFAIRHLAHKFL
jgi:hypothetical protein